MLPSCSCTVKLPSPLAPRQPQVVLYWPSGTYCRRSIQPLSTLLTEHEHKRPPFQEVRSSALHEIYRRSSPSGVHGPRCLDVVIAAASIYPTHRCNLTWLSNNLSGSYKRAVGVAMQIARALHDAGDEASPLSAADACPLIVVVIRVWLPWRRPERCSGVGGWMCQTVDQTNNNQWNCRLVARLGSLSTHCTRFGVEEGV